MRISLAVFAFLVGALLPAPARGAGTLLQEQLLKEPVGELVKAARELGDAGRGAVLFFQPFLTCAKCHDGDAGTQLGPDLTKVGREATAECLVESVLNPSKVLKKGYETVNVTTKDERTPTGLVVSETAASLILVDPSANGNRITVLNG